MSRNKNVEVKSVEVVASNLPKVSAEQVAEAAALNAKAITDRRAGLDRRKVRGAAAGGGGEGAYTGPERRSVAEVHAEDETGLHRLRGPGRRREDERRSAEEGEMTANQFEFVMAVEAYKKVNHKMYPTWTEIMEVLTQLGYRKILTRTINLPNVPEAPLYTELAEWQDDDEGGTESGGAAEAA